MADAKKLVKEFVEQSKSLTEPMSLSKPKELLKNGFLNFAKWFAAGLSIWFVTTYVIPWVSKIPFLAKFTKGGKIVASIFFVLLGLAVAAISWAPAQFIAAGLGIAGMLTLIATMAMTLIEKAKALRGA